MACHILPEKGRMARASDLNPWSCHLTKHKPPLDCHSLICAYITGQEWDAHASDSNPCPWHFSPPWAAVECHNIWHVCLHTRAGVSCTRLRFRPMPVTFPPPWATAGLSQCLTRMFTYPGRSELHTPPIPSHARDISPHHEPPLDCHRPWLVYGFHLHRIRYNDSFSPTDPNDRPLESLKKEKLMFVKH